MQDELGTIRRSINGRRLFTSEQKAKLVQLWDQIGERAAEFARRLELRDFDVTRAASGVEAVEASKKQ